MATTITRKEYDAAGAGTVLGLGCTTKSEEFDGAVSVGGISIDDAFNVDEIALDASGVAATSPMAKSTGILSLAADIASVRLQPRLIPSAFTTPKVNGLEMQEKTGEGVPEGYKVFALPKDGEEVTYTSKAASLAAVDDTFSWTDADGGHSFTRSELMVAVAECLGAAGVTGCVALGKMSEVVSFNDYMTDTEALMDGRTSMAGYPVEGATDVVWATVPYAQLMSMAEKEFKGTKVLTALLVALGMPSGMARSECQLLSGGSLKVMTLNGGVLSSDTALQYGTDSLLACKAGSTQRPWIDCGIDGGSMLQWLGNQCVFSLLAAMAKKRMDSLCGLALVGVGENGGVMSWMVKAHEEYGIPYGNLVKAFIEYPILKTFFESDNDTIYSIIEIYNSEYKEYLSVLNNVSTNKLYSYEQQSASSAVNTGFDANMFSQCVISTVFGKGDSSKRLGIFVMGSSPKYGASYYFNNDKYNTQENIGWTSCTPTDITSQLGRILIIKNGTKYLHCVGKSVKEFSGSSSGNLQLRTSWDSQVYTSYLKCNIWK